MPSLGLQTRTRAGASRLRVPTGGWNVLVGGRLPLGLRFWFPPDPRRRCCSTFLNLNWYAMIEFFNHGTQWGASCLLSPTLLLDLRLEAGYTFAPFGDTVFDVIRPAFFYFSFYEAADPVSGTSEKKKICLHDFFFISYHVIFIFEKKKKKKNCIPYHNFRENLNKNIILIWVFYYFRCRPDQYTNKI